MLTPSTKSAEQETKPHLERQLTLLGATSLNMSNMVGSGLFVSLPLMIGAMGGPQALIGWLLGGLIAISDGLVWSELGAALPGSGGSYVYLREAFGPRSWGRLAAFFFIFQLICSGPLEIASACIAIAQYLGYLWHGMTSLDIKLVAVGVATVSTALLYTRLRSTAKLMLGLWVGVLVTVGWIIFAGLSHFNSALAFSFPPGAFSLNNHFFTGLGLTTNYVMYCFLGYYAICYVGDEVVRPARTIPRSVILSIVAVLLLDFLFCLSIVGVIPWKEVMQSQFIAADFMEKVYGRWAGLTVCLLMIWVSFAGVYAMILTYSRTPYAAALDGNFFRIFAKIHPKKHIPHISLLLIGGLSVMAGFLSLDEVIKALMTARILSQFLAQIVGLECLRRYRPEVVRPFRMILYPLPSALAFLGWIFVFVNTGPIFIVFGLLILVLGCLGFLGISRRNGTWPFVTPMRSVSDYG